MDGSSDYRNSQTWSNNMSSTTSYHSQQQNQQKTYSSALTQESFLTKEQAILFNSLDGIRLQEYIFALGTLIGPSIIFSLRISNNRICIYLFSKEKVNQFLSEYGSININNVCRLVLPAQHLLLSKVSPTIPHLTLENNLKNLGLKLVSPITFLKIGVNNPEYNHILSFRRQVYTLPPENIEVPNSMVVTHEDTSYRIFLSLDGLACFECKKSGHIAANCPN